MHKSAQVDASVVRGMIQLALATERSGLLLHRLDSVLMVAQGRSCSEVANWSLSIRAYRRGTTCDAVPTTPTSAQVAAAVCAKPSASSSSNQMLYVGSHDGSGCDVTTVVDKPADAHAAAAAHAAGPPPATITSARALPCPLKIRVGPSA